MSPPSQTLAVVVVGLTLLHVCKHTYILCMFIYLYIYIYFFLSFFMYVKHVHVSTIGLRVNPI